MKKKMFKSLMLIGVGVAGTLMYEKYNNEIKEMLKDGYDLVTDKVYSCTNCDCKEN
ncbi:MAG: hypothetical protein IJZ36_03555 [Bacilli bacterium]|nr:hypothetical protein [Bacilli bacterium]